MAAQATAKIRPKLAKGYFQMKEVDTTTELIARMSVERKVEKAARAELNCLHVATLQFEKLCRERQPLWNRHDGLNLTCLDQCHGVQAFVDMSFFCCCARTAPRFAQGLFSNKRT